MFQRMIGKDQLPTPTQVGLDAGKVKAHVRTSVKGKKYRVEQYERHQRMIGNRIAKLGITHPVQRYFYRAHLTKKRPLADVHEMWKRFSSDVNLLILSDQLFRNVPKTWQEKDEEFKLERIIENMTPR